MSDTDMILTRARFAELERRLFNAESLLRAAKFYVDEVAYELGPKSATHDLADSIDLFLR